VQTLVYTQQHLVGQEERLHFLIKAEFFTEQDQVRTLICSMMGGLDILFR